MASRQPNLPQSDKICQDGPCEQNPTITQQASNFIQQTGEQVKNMAQGAAEAVKSTLGMNPDNASNSPTAANLPSNTASKTATATTPATATKI